MANFDKNIRYIIKNVPFSVRLRQLAEEAAELSAAASKLARIEDKCSPSPVSHQEAYAAMCEEIADVQLCLYACDRDINSNPYVSVYMDTKAERWVGRLKGECETGREGTGEKAPGT